jgi:signal transduction histidine kinase
MPNRILPGMEFYRSNSNLKWIILVVSSLISIGSIYYTDRLVKKLKDRERQDVQLFARAIEYASKEDFNTNMVFVTEEIINKNNSVPLILTDAEGQVIFARNVSVDSTQTATQIQKQLQREAALMQTYYDPIIIDLRDPSNNNEAYAQQKVYYKNSTLLIQLTAFPYVQLSVIAIFAFISYLAFNYSKAAEQNRVWVGLAKETAHQLGTPLSSLMAWVEVLRDDPELKKKGLVEELDKDVRKLRVVTERFSSIGSTPHLKPENIYHLISNVVGYLEPRVSSKINFEVYSLSENIMANVHAPLFEWVIENLCKNAVDAIGTSGTVAIKVLRGSDKKVFIDISDTGKGIPKANQASIFKPGFTTKKRGWGLGLTLAQRIIEMYHNGRIFIKSSEENLGTTFRIELNSL